MRRRSPTLTEALSTLTVALVLASIAAIVAVVTISERQGRDDIELRFGRTSTVAVNEALGRHLDPAAPLLAEARQRAERGVLVVENPPSLSDYLTDKVRHHPGVAFFYYGDQTTGRFVGAWRRDDGAIMLRQTAPDVDGGRAFEWEVGPDGRRTPYEQNLVPGYDSRSRPWYQQAVAQRVLAWTEPYPFASGASGLPPRWCCLTPAASGLAASSPSTSP
jgi:hypothetical protein